MNCIGLILYMYCFQAGPVVVSDFCKLAEPLVTQDRYKPSRKDSERSLRRYAALKTRYNKLCREKVQPK